MRPTCDLDKTHLDTSDKLALVLEPVGKVAAAGATSLRTMIARAVAIDGATVDEDDRWQMNDGDKQSMQSR
jgi:hypothetical protein